MNLRTVFSIFTVLAATSTASAQGTKDDYDRAAALRERFSGKVLNERVRVRWTKDGERLWYRRELPDGKSEYVSITTASGERTSAFDHAKLAEALGRVTDSEIAADRLPIERLRIADDGKSAAFHYRRGWRVDLETYAIEESESPPADPPRERRRRGQGRRRWNSRAPKVDSPDGKWTAFIREHNLVVRAKESDDEFALTEDGTDEHDYTPPLVWSPDSRRLVALRRREAEEHIVHFVESSPDDQVQPKLHSHQYLKPGDRIATSAPQLFDVTERRRIPVSDELFANPWRVRNLRWPSAQRFTFLYNQRGHQVLRVVAVDAETGEAGAVIDETSPTFIDYAHKTFAHYLDDAREIIWMSERDGWNHLYLIDSRTGAVKNQITSGEWVVRGVDRVDEEKREIWFRAGGIYPEQDPYYVHFARVRFDGTGLVILTEGNGTHEVEPSPDGRFLVDRYSRVDRPPVTELRRAETGELVTRIEEADASALAAAGWRAPERFVATGRDGKTKIYGIIIRPTRFDPTVRYPVIESIYAGPHSAHVPKSFRAYYRQQALAELGFVVVRIDGMGTSHRSKAFHDVCWRNLKDAGFPDRILWMKAVAEKYPALDLDRVGIYGGSAGGQNTLSALLHHGDFYKVGVSDCGCHDNRMDKIWWNELWMGWPVGPEYADNSNVTHAAKLEGKLLLTVGELDRNVDPASTMQVVDALIRADKDFEMIVFPGAGHGVGESPYAVRKRRDFFVRHLLGVEPRRGPATAPSDSQ